MWDLHCPIFVIVLVLPLVICAIPDSFADRLYAWRKQNNYSPGEAALKLQLSVRTLQEENKAALAHIP